MRDLTPSRARAVATTAYLFCFPLVMNYRDMYRHAIDTASPTHSSGFGRWRHTSIGQRRRAGPGRPREVVVVSSVWLDVRAEPWWCEVGDVPSEVQFSGRWLDLWGFTLKSDPLRQRVEAGGAVLASAPMRVVGVPPEISGIVRGESGFVALRTETRWRDPFALLGAQPVMPDIVMEPVSEHLGWAAPKPSPAIDWFPWHDGVESTDAFWSCASFALSLTTSTAEDRPILDRIAEVGVVAGRSWDPSAFSHDVLDAIGGGMDDALSDLLEAASDVSHRHATDVCREDMDRDYFWRALSALGAVGQVAEA
jgi:hypothetical protein